MAGSTAPMKYPFNNDKKYGDVKWRKSFRSSFLALTSLCIVAMLFLCNATINELHIGRRGIWNNAGFASNFQNCSNPVPDRDANIYDYRPLKTEATHQVPLGAGTKALPKGIVEATTDLELRHLWILPDNDAHSPQNLLALAVGIKQKNSVDKMIQKFPADNFTIMLFHYDGKVDDWTDLEWTSKAIHVMAFNQTKWWFAKRFLHPDVVHKYNYIFLWDEDLGVEHFHAGRYLDIMEDEGFEISQPALSRNSSEVHHRLTLLDETARAHRRIYSNRHLCDDQSTGPPCTGWVEMMAPVFSRAAWRCAWNMVQNDLIHAWGLDYKLGYCAQGIRSEKVGIIDAEFVVHEGIPTLGGPKRNKTAPAPSAIDGNNSRSGNSQSGPLSKQIDTRVAIRRRARVELNAFARQWTRSAVNDAEWEDPYDEPEPNSVERPAEQPPARKEEVRQTERHKGKKSKKTRRGSQRRMLRGEPLRY